MQPRNGGDTTQDSLDAGYSLQSEIISGSMTARSKNTAFKVATYMDDAQINQSKFNGIRIMKGI